MIVTQVHFTYEVKHLSERHESMQSIHDFFDRRCVVPEMDVENVDVSRTETLKAILHGELERLDVVSAIVNLLRKGLIAKARVVGILQKYRLLGSQDNMRVVH